MGRKAKDPALNQLARELREIVFTADADVDSAATSLHIDELRRVRLASNFKTYQVRYFIGGKYRIIGYTENFTAACRFADMAEWRFWIYRVRDAHPPVDSDLHFGVEQAKEDCANETAANALLSRIEVHLRESGTIPDYKTIEAQKDAKQKQKEVRRTVRGDLYALFTELMGALQEISERLKRIERIVLTEAVAETFKQTVEPPVNNLEWQKDFIVNVPHPSKPEEVLKKVLIQIPVRVENGQEIIQPQGLALIEQTKRDHLQQYEQVMQQQKQLVDIFSDPTQTQPIKPNE